MAITNLNVSARGNLSTSITIAEGSGNDRMVIAGGAQNRGTLNLSSFTLDGVAPTGSISVTDEGSLRSTSWYWLDGDIPATSGSYTVAMTGPDSGASIGAISASSVKQAIPADITPLTSATAVGSISATLTADAGSVAVNIMAQGNSSTHTVNGNMTVIIDPATESKEAMYYNVTDLDVGITSMSPNTTYSFVAFAMEPAGAAGPAVTQADTTPEDGVQQSFTSTGLTVAYTASSVAGKSIQSGLSNTDPTTASTYTLDVSAVTASEGMPRVGETSTLSVTATGGTATTDVVIQPKTGWTTVTLAGTLDKTASGFLHSLDADLGLTSAVGDIIYYSNARGEAITATGVYTGGTTVAYQSTAFVIQQGGSATTTATSEGDAFYPFGEGGGGTGIPKTKFRRFPWQSWNPL